MRPRNVTSTRPARASASEVWELLADLHAWPDWAPVRSVELERPGDDEPHGVGAVRALRTITGVTRERVTLVEAPHRQDYELLSGLPVQDYRATVEVAPQPDGTCEIHWSSTFRSSWASYTLIRLAIPAFARGLARAASRRAAPVVRSPGH
jgi:hypothetical protein